MNIRDFRRQLSSVLDMLSFESGMVIDIGPKRNDRQIIATSMDSMKMYEARAVVNQRLFDTYSALHLDDYLTILKSENDAIKSLPQPFKSALSDWFKLAYVVLEDISHSTIECDTLRINIFDFLNDTSSDIVTGRVNYIRDVNKRFFTLDEYDESITVEEYYRLVFNDMIEWDLDVVHLSVPQVMMIRAAITHVANMMYSVISYQKMAVGMYEEDVNASILPIIEWFDTYMANDEHVWMYNGRWEYTPIEKKD